MYSLEPFKIDLREAKDSEKTIGFDLGDDYFKAIGGSEVKSGTVRMDVSIRNTAGTFELRFSFRGMVNVPCDLCLDEMAQPVDGEGSLFARLGDEYSEDDDLITVDKADGLIDLSWFIYEFVALAIPVRHVHEQGRCNKEMAALLKEHEAGAATEAEQGEETDPRWSELKKLKTIIKD